MAHHLPASLRSLAAAFAGTLALAAPLPAAAQACAGFSDVAQTDPVCPDVEWIRNRNVTLGCAPGLYCPNAAVPRREMAAFLSRLGQVLQPAVLRSPDAGVAATISLTGAVFSNVVCQTPAFLASGYPRRATMSGFLSGRAVADQAVIVDIVASFDNGATWQLTRDAINAATFPAIGAASVTVTGDIDLDAGETVRFGIAPTATGPQASPTLSAYCGLTVDVHSRTGSTAPRDRVTTVDPRERAANAFGR